VKEKGLAAAGNVTKGEKSQRAKKIYQWLTFCQRVFVSCHRFSPLGVMNPAMNPAATVQYID
jgi:hypothetical protein